MSSRNNYLSAEEREQAASLYSVLQQTAQGAQQSKVAGSEFSQLADQMQSLISQFKTESDAMAS